MTSKEALLLRLALTQRTVAHRKLQEELQQDQARWDIYAPLYTRILSLYAQPWTMREQYQFERNLKPGDQIRIFWSNKTGSYTGKAVYLGTSGKMNQWANVELAEDVEEAEKKKGEQMLIPFATFVQRFYLRKNSLFPFLEKDLK